MVAPGWVAAAHRATAHAALVGGVNRVLGEPLDPDAEILNPGGVIRGSFGNAVLGCNFAVRRADYLAIGGFDESLPPYGCDDVEFSLRMNEAGRTVVGDPDLQIHFRRTTGTRALLRKTYLSGLAETVVWARHADRYGDQLRGRRRIASLLRWPGDTVAVAVRQRALPGRSAARDLTTRVARVVGWWSITHRRSLPPPGLLEHDGDPGP